MQQRLNLPVGKPAASPTRRFDPAAYGLSRPTFIVLAIKLAGVSLLVLAVLHFGQVRQKLSEAALRSLLVQADTLVAMLTTAWPADSPQILWLGAQPAGGADTTPAQGTAPPLETAIDRSAVERLFSAVLEGSGTRVRLYGIDGQRLTDSRIALRDREDVAIRPLAPLGDAPAEAAVGPPGPWQWLTRRIATSRLPLEPAEPRTRANQPEVDRALDGVKAAEQRVTASGDIVVSLATPIFDDDGRIAAALQLSTAAPMINAAAADYERTILRIWAAALLLTATICLIVAMTVSRPVARLASAAERVKRGGPYIPVRGLREDSQLGQLDRLLQDMTNALYSRIDSIEAFAGEVAHEVKNPLTSLRSAVETLPLVKTQRARDQLMEVITHDVQRIDRLISDISSASKLDAELNRHRYTRVDLVRLLHAVVATQDELAAERTQHVELRVRSTQHPNGFLVMGNDGRLGQVFTNLVDNGRSFTPEGGSVRVSAARLVNFIEVVVDDEGPGIRDDMLERIFERFYTDRAAQRSFGNNSGLGLAICKQIIEAHDGEIFAENRYRTTLTRRDVEGARFTVRLPVAA